MSIFHSSNPSGPIHCSCTCSGVSLVFHDCFVQLDGCAVYVQMRQMSIPSKAVLIVQHKIAASLQDSGVLESLQDNFFFFFWSWHMVIRCTWKYWKIPQEKDRTVGVLLLLVGLLMTAFDSLGKMWTVFPFLIGEWWLIALSRYKTIRVNEKQAETVIYNKWLFLPAFSVFVLIHVLHL